MATGSTDCQGWRYGAQGADPQPGSGQSRGARRPLTAGQERHPRGGADRCRWCGSKLVNGSAVSWAAGGPIATLRQATRMTALVPGDRRWWLMIRGANRYGFSDDGAILKTPLLMRALRTVGIVRLSGLRQIAVTAHYITTFFDVYLKGEPASELRIGKIANKLRK